MISMQLAGAIWSGKAEEILAGIDACILVRHCRPYVWDQAGCKNWMVGYLVELNIVTYIQLGFFSTYQVRPISARNRKWNFIRKQLHACMLHCRRDEYVLCSVIYYVRKTRNCEPLLQIFAGDKQFAKGPAAYQLGNTSSRTITEVKQRWARLVLG